MMEDIPNMCEYLKGFFFSKSMELESIHITHKTMYGNLRITLVPFFETMALGSPQLIHSTMYHGSQYFVLHQNKHVWHIYS